MKRVKNFILYWVHNGVIIYFASQIFPTKFVLGNFRFTALLSILVSAFSLTLFLEIVSIGLSKVKKIKFDSNNRFVTFWIANFLGLWLIARMAPLTGFGVVRFTWLIGLSFLVNILQSIIHKK